MKIISDRYKITIGKTHFDYEFISVGTKGEIDKLVQFIPMEVGDFYNLAFGDKDEFGELDDLSISDNGDSQRVLATVATAVYAFTDIYPDAFIFATGSTSVRTRLYRIGISTNFAAIKEDFDVYGLLGEDWEEFELNKPYEAFFVKRKS